MPLDVLVPTTHARRALALLLVTLLSAVALVHAPAAAAGVTVKDCRSPEVPAGFHHTLVTAIRASGNLPKVWADSPYLAKILCWQDTDLDPAFHAHGYGQRWYGMFAMSTRELRTIAGPWMSNDRFELILSPTCFVSGWVACANDTAHARTIQQLIAGMRWIWLNYGSPVLAWRHIVRTGRFTSYPRPGTDDTPTSVPLRRCPVTPPVSYRDSLGEARPVGGFHPHWGNDIGAPIRRPIRAPFAGLAVGHDDGWFAGKYVTVVGREGYVRNGHLSRFGRLGWVKAGAIIGYVGQTGDARSPHDHFEWHPWNVPHVLHRSPYGYARILDAVDPYPYLNRVCR
jgi:hypothetical protein